MQAYRSRRAALSFLVISVAVDLLAFGIIIPVLPRLVQGLLGGETVSAAQVYGLFGLTWAVMQFFGAPILGVLSDACGRRPVISCCRTWLSAWITCSWPLLPGSAGS